MNQATTTQNTSPLINNMFHGFSLSDMKDMAFQNPYLRGYLQGYFSERMLARELAATPGVESVEKIPDVSTRRGDFLIKYQDKEITVECKSIQTGSVRFINNNFWEGSVLVKNVGRKEIHLPDIGPVYTSNLLKGQFDILAICCFAVRGEWKFVFMNNSDLPEKKDYPGLIRSAFKINPFTDQQVHTSIISLLEQRSS